MSLALVSEDGQSRFYAEVSPLPKEPTDFVRHVAYPLLEHGYSARQPVDITRDMRAFLARFVEAFVLFDHHTDGTLFRHALGGFDLPLEVTDRLGPEPKVTTTLIGRDDVQRGIEQYFREHPGHAGRRHHAGIDAEALRRAFIAALEKMP